MPGSGDAQPLCSWDRRNVVKCVIVDDNESFLAAAIDLLARGGVDVVGTASNSADAIRLVEELQPDVTLVDVNLGGEDGLELARELGAASKVILVSTLAEEDLAELIAASPAIGFVSKARLSEQAIRDLLQRAA